MGMKRKILSPGMEYGSNTNRGSQVFIIHGKLHKRFPCRFYEDGVDKLLVLECYSVEFMGDSKYNVKVMSGQKL
jgi:hypothetical protein